jgi:hypothetical protein
VLGTAGLAVDAAEGIRDSSDGLISMSNPGGSKVKQDHQDKVDEVADDARAAVKNGEEVEVRLEDQKL